MRLEMTTGYEDSRRKSCKSTGWLKYNRFEERGYGIIVADDDGREIFAHIKSFFGYGKSINDKGIYKLEYRRRLRFRRAVDSFNDRIVARDITPIREIRAPDGTVMVLPSPDELFAARKEAEAERATNTSDLAEQESQPRSDGFGALVAALR
jgi:cold shock CspA family protein